MKKKSQELLEESKKRRTYRQFLPDPLDMDVIKNCVLTAGTAPNGADKQPWHFTIVTDPAMKQRIREEAEKVEKNFYEKQITDEWQADLDKLSVTWEKPFLTEAPCLIAIFKEYYRMLPDGTKDKNYYVNESIGISIGFLINAIRNAGLVSLTYTPAPPTFLRELLGRPEGETPVMVLVVGKPDPDYELPTLKKKTFEEIADII
ncbi:nitroreductase family protein [Emergencia sp.]|uniref:nitroreductase family protein n=1 Tax=Emergencia sp. TaxID=1926557 RepID=UPI003AF11FD5